MLSCFAGDTQVTKVLLGHGADTNLQNEDGISPHDEQLQWPHRDSLVSAWVWS